MNRATRQPLLCLNVVQRGLDVLGLKLDEVEAGPLAQLVHRVVRYLTQGGKEKTK